MPARLAVVAHQSRSDQAHALQEQIGAVFLSMSNGNWNCNQNHLRCWRWLSEHPGDADFLVVVEDDALPVDGFTGQLEQVLESAPEPIVSLYLGQKRPPQHQHLIGAVIQRATELDAHWITGTDLFHAVGVAIRTELVKPMLAGLLPELPIDEAIGHWAVLHKRRIAYTHPSIVDHYDGPSLVSHRDNQERTAGRIAWRVGTRETWNPIGQVRMN